MDLRTVNMFTDTCQTVFDMMGDESKFSGKIDAKLNLDSLD